MAEHTKGARGSTHDKHTDRQKQDKQKKKETNWTHQGKNTNHGDNKNQKKK